MTGVSLVLLAVLGQAPAGDPSELVHRLGAPRYADREEASDSLERLGRGALPALRAARDLKDLEVRTRAAALVTRIEGALLTKPTTVALNFQDAPLPDVVKSLADQTGLKVTLIPEVSPAWNGRRITIHEPTPLPFWKAVDRLCEAGHLQYNYGVHSYAGREPTFPLFDGAGRPAMPTCDSGPFRVTVVGLHFQRDVTFTNAPAVVRTLPGQVLAPPRPAPSINEQFFAQIQVTGEPRLSLGQNGPLRVIEAVDDKGQILAAPTAAGSPMSQRMSGYFGFAAGSSIQLHALMSRPRQPSASIRRLKGVIPVAVSTRKPNPLTVPVAGAVGRTFQNEDVTLTVQGVHGPAENRPATLEIVIRPVGSGAGASPGDAGIRPEAYQQQIQVVDAQGQPIAWYQTGFDAEAGRLTLTFPGHEPRPAAELRYFGLVRATAEVPFEFNDLPMP